MGFIKFENYNKKGRQLTISISDKVFILSSVFIEKYNLQSYKYVNLYYDKEAISIGIEFVNTRERHSFSLNKTGTTTRTIVCRSFFNFFEIDMRLYNKRYKPTFQEMENKKIFIIKLENKNN